MKIKRLIAINLIFIVILSSMGFYCITISQDVLSYNDVQSSSATQLVADTQDPSHEFREGFKTNHTTQSSSVTSGFFHVASQCSFQLVKHAQYEAYQQNLLSYLPSAKLFLDFGALII